MNSQVSTLDSRYESIHTDFNALSLNKQEEALEETFNGIQGCLQETKACYRFITKEMDTDPDEPRIPAMLIPAMLGMGYKEQNDVEHFKSRFLRVYGEEGTNWVIKTKRNVFSYTSRSGSLENFQKCSNFYIANGGNLEFKIPGRESGSIILRKNAGNRANWPFITPRFARWLLTHMDRPISHQLVDFYFLVHDCARRLKQEIDAGEIVLIKKQLSPSEELIRPTKRQRTAAASAELMGLRIHTVDGTKQTLISNRYCGPRIHDALNVAFCGYTRKQVSKGLNYQGANVSDHDTPEQEAWKIAVKYRLTSQVKTKLAKGEKLDSNDVLELNRQNIDHLSHLLPEIQLDGIVEEPLTLEEAQQILKQERETS